MQIIKLDNLLTNGKAVTLCNIYRPPKENDSNHIIEQFISEFEIILNDLNKSKSLAIVCGDFNINLLQLGVKDTVNDYFDMLSLNGLRPCITYPSRIGRNSATLIDNIFTSFMSPTVAFTGIIATEMSDHFPCVTALQLDLPECNSYKNIYKRNFCDSSIKNVFDELNSNNILGSIDTGINGDPDTNYNILHNVIASAIENHMPLKKIRLNKHKHKKSSWITAGIINSIKYRDKLYRSLKQSDQNSNQYSSLQLNLKTYNRILKKLIRNTKAKYFHSQFENCKGDSKQTWKNIKQLLHNSDPKKLPDYFTANDSKIENNT